MFLVLFCCKKQKKVQDKNRERQNVLNDVPNWSMNDPLNMSYLTDSYIGFTLKMESVSKNTIFGLKMMVKSGLEKIILKSLHAGR